MPAALAAFQSVAETLPAVLEPLVLHNIALCHLLLSRPCVQLFYRNIEKHPAYVPSYNACAFALLTDSPEQAIRLLVQATRVSQHPQTYMLLSKTYKQQGHMAESARAYSVASILSQRLHATSTDLVVRAYAETGDGACFVLHRGAATLLDCLYTDEIAPSHLLLLHQAVMHTPTCPPQPLKAGGSIGFVSEHFRKGSIFSNISPLLKQLSARGEATRCFDVSRGDHDRVQVPGGFSPIDRLGECDVIVCLDGCTGTLAALATAAGTGRCVVDFVGYAHSTGHPAVQYKIVDSTTDPVGKEDVYTERLKRLDPCFLCWEPPEWCHPPVVHKEGLRLLANHNFSKLSDATLDMYRRILDRHPHSSLSFKGSFPPTALQRQRVAHEMARYGDRVKICDSIESGAEYYAFVAGFHLAIDALSYNATVTCLECIYCGVPFVTVTGSTHRSRVATSILKAIGRSDCVFDDIEALVSGVAATASKNLPCREALLSSPLLDHATYATKFMKLIGEMRSGT